MADGALASLEGGGSKERARIWISRRAGSRPPGPQHKGRPQGAAELPLERAKDPPSSLGPFVGSDREGASAPSAGFEPADTGFEGRGCKNRVSRGNHQVKALSANDHLYRVSEKTIWKTPLQENANWVVVLPILRAQGIV